MPNWNNWTDATRGAAGGAATGAAIGSMIPGVGTLIGGGIGGAIGFISGLASDSPDVIRQRRKVELLKSIAGYRERSLKEGVAKINKFITGQVKNVQQGGAKRALSMGRQGEGEAFITSGVSNVLEQGSRATEGFLESTNRYYDQAELGVEQDWAGRPIEPSLTDVVEELGIAGLQYDAAQKRIAAMKQIYGSGEKPSYENLNVGDVSKLQDSIDTTPRIDLMQNVTARAPVQIGELPEQDNDFSMIRPLTMQGSPLKPRKPTNLVDMYRNLIGR
ncbi:MAG: hypothetical protein KKB38_20485 [Gammaproteobacteria bacterium]|nr:hypothetical protein [Gammaproteobacteria bacterium]